MSAENSEISLTISAVGDISLGDHPVCVGHGMRSVMDRNPESIFQEVTEYLQDSDITLGNLETVTSDHGLRSYWLPSYEMRGKPAHLKWLKAAGFNVLGVANNHAMQHGQKAFTDMVNRLREQGFSVIGVDDSKGRTKVHEIEHETGEKSAIFSVSIRPEEWTTERPVPYSLREEKESLLSEVRDLREKYSPFLICSIHWGLEFLDYPGPEQIQLGRDLVDNGVDLVIGHHSHVLQPVERYKQGLIFHSLGNFVFDLWQRETRFTAIAKISLSTHDAPKFAYIPAYIDADKRVRLLVGRPTEKVDMLLSWQRFEKKADAANNQYLYYDKYKSASRKFRYSSYRYFLKNFFRYPFHFLFQSIGRTILRRVSGK